MSQDTASVDSGLGLWYADLPIESVRPRGIVRFTFYWSDVRRWEGTDFHVASCGSPHSTSRLESANSDGDGVSSMHRALNGDVLVHHLTQDERLIDPSLLARHGRSARTLVKEGPLRLTIMVIAAGGALPVHSTDGPVTVHLLDGEIEFNAAGQDYPLVAGDILVFAPGVEHSARSVKGGTFLLTVVHLGRAFDA